MNNHRMYNHILSIFLIFSGCIPSFAQVRYGSQEASNQSSDFIWPDGKKMAISLTFDDARLSQIDVGVPIMNKYDVKGTFYVSQDRMIERLEGWKDALKAGHEIGNHTLTHPCTGNFPWARQKALESFTLRDIALEMEEANRMISETLGVSPVSFAFPCGQKFIGRGSSLRSYIPLVSDLFLTGRGWMDEGPNDPVYCDLAQLTGMESDNKSFEQIKALIDQAAKMGPGLFWLVMRLENRISRLPGHPPWNRSVNMPRIRHMVSGSHP